MSLTNEGPYGSCLAYTVPSFIPLVPSVSRPIRPCGAHLRWSDGETEDEREERGTHALPLSLRLRP